jgi:hypothetical protein
VIILRYQALCDQESYQNISHTHYKTHRFFQKKAFLVSGEDPDGKFFVEEPKVADVVYLN